MFQICPNNFQAGEGAVAPCLPFIYAYEQRCKDFVFFSNSSLSDCAPPLQLVWPVVGAWIPCCLDEMKKDIYFTNKI